jgi:hypothetical protein
VIFRNLRPLNQSEQWVYGEGRESKIEAVMWVAVRVLTVDRSHLILVEIREEQLAGRTIHGWLWKRKGGVPLTNESAG